MNAMKSRGKVNNDMRTMFGLACFYAAFLLLRVSMTAADVATPHTTYQRPLKLAFIHTSGPSNLRHQQQSTRRRTAKWQSIPLSSTTEGSMDEMMVEKKKEKDDTSVLHDAEQQQRQNNQRVLPDKQQIWLDLRGTALYPAQALSFLSRLLSSGDGDDDDGDDEFLADDCSKTILDNVRVLLDEETFFKAVSSSSSKSTSTAAGLRSSLLYVTDNGDLIASNDNQLAEGIDTNIMPEPQCIPVGRVFYADNENRNSIIDPMQALDVTSNGEWILMDTTHYAEFESRKDDASVSLEEEISSLLDFLNGAMVGSGSLNLSSMSSPIGMTMPGLSTTSTTDRPSGIIGDSPGIAISCRSKAHLVRVHRALKKASFLSTMMTSSTDSGILVPTVIPDVIGTSSSSGFTGASPSAPKISTALVLPFETALWETLKDLLEVE